MAQNINQFAQTLVQGQLDLEVAGTVVSAAVSSSQATALVAGQAVKLDTANGNGAPKVLALASSGDNTYGFVVRNLKDQSFPANARIELALDNSVMVMTAQTANPAITRGGAVEYDFATNTVLAWGGINPYIGFAYDSAVNAGDLLRVLISVPAFRSSAGVKNVSITATLAQINAGTVLIPGVAGKLITVTNYSAVVVGAFATGTSVELESTNASPVAVTTIAEAALTNNAVLTPNSANTTLGVGFGQALGTGDGLKIINNGSAQTGGTSIKFNLSYVQA